MTGFHAFGEITTWLCEQEDAMYAMIQIHCDQHPNGIWVAVVHFLEGYIHMVGQYFLGAEQQYTPLCAFI